MKHTVEGKRYNSDNMEKLCERDHYNNGNYTGTTELLLAKDGTYHFITRSNGQDFYVQDGIRMCYADELNGFLDIADITDEQESRLVELELIELV